MHIPDGTLIHIGTAERPYMNHQICVPAGDMRNSDKRKSFMKWKPKTVDYKLSPYTGLTRDSWLEAAEYMLEGIFRHIRRFEDPVVVPRQETEITYPHLQDPSQAQRSQRSAEIFEGLTRSFFIAAPLMANRPEANVCGYSLTEYYKYQVLRSCTRLRPLYNAAGEDESYVGTYQELQAINHTQDPYSCYQQTVETCALVICLWISRAQIWDTYTSQGKDTIAAFLTGGFLGGRVVSYHPGAVYGP